MLPDLPCNDHLWKKYLSSIDEQILLTAISDMDEIMDGGCQKYWNMRVDRFVEYEFPSILDLLEEALHFLTVSLRNDEVSNC